MRLKLTLYNLNGENNVDLDYKDNALGFVWNYSRVYEFFTARGTTFYILGPRYMSAFWNYSRVYEFFTARGTMFYILGPRYMSAFKPELTDLYCFY